MLVGGSGAAFAECRYRLDDNMEFARREYADDGWLPGYKVSTSEVRALWIRCHVRAASPNVRGLVLHLGRIADADETYVNGTLVGRSELEGSRDLWNYFLSRRYFVSPELMQPPEEAIVAIRVSSRSFGLMGLLDGPPALSRDWQSTAPKVADVLGAVFAIVVCMMLAATRIQAASLRDLRKVLLLFGVSVAILEFLNSFYLYRAFFSNAGLWLKIHIAITVIAALLVEKFIAGFLGKRVPRWAYLLTWGTAIVAFLVPGLGSDPEQARRMTLLFGAWGLPTLIYAGYLFHLAISATRRISAIFPIILGGASLIGLGLFDIVLLNRGILPITLPASGIGFLVFFLMASLSLILRDKEFETQEFQSAAQLASQVAHDIRSPLAALQSIAGDLDGLEEDKRLIVRSVAARIQDIANNLLARKGPKARAGDVRFAHGRAQRGSAKEPVMLVNLINALVSEKRLQYRACHGISIEERYDRRSYGLFAEIPPPELLRSLSNIINNGVEAIKSEGTVCVTLGCANDESLEITIADSGCGIPHDVLARLGHRGETHGKPGGLGLGLYHARLTAEAARGTLEIASEVGKGTRVTLRLPRAPIPAWFVPELVVRPDASIVVLDDDLSIHQIWDGRLESLQGRASEVRIHHFSSSKSFIEFVSGMLMDRTGQVICLVDYELLGEESNGLDVIERTGIPEHAILVTSRYEEPDIRERCARLGVRIIPKGMAAYVPINVR